MGYLRRRRRAVHSTHVLKHFLVRYQVISQLLACLAHENPCSEASFEGPWFRGQSAATPPSCPWPHLPQHYFYQTFIAQTCDDICMARANGVRHITNSNQNSLPGLHSETQRQRTLSAILYYYLEGCGTRENRIKV